MKYKVTPMLRMIRIIHNIVNKNCVIVFTRFLFSGWALLQFEL